jgi:hypothetical protein
MSKDILGSVVQKIVKTPAEMLGVICDLLEKLSGEFGREWFIELKKFLRKEQSWVGVVEEKILRLISGRETLTIDALDGSDDLLADDGTFAWIDSDFKNYGADEACRPTAEINVEVHEMVKNVTFAQMFGSLSSDLQKLCFSSRAQIKSFVKKHRQWIKDDGRSALFLYKSNGQYFVAVVCVRSDGLHVRVRRFEFAYLWNAGYCHRIVVPQL